jgi:hypothetical protein
MIVGENMIRNDIYCLYKGKEYRLVHKADGTYEIVTKNQFDVDEAFDFYQNDIYRKQIELDEVEEVYSINSFAVYNGDIFGVSRPLGVDVELYTSNVELAVENRMNQIGKSEYVKIVSQSEVEVYEEKKPLNLKNID